MKAGWLWILTLLALILRIALTTLAGWQPLLAIDPLLVVSILASLPGRPQLAIGAGLLTGLLDDAWSSRWFGEGALTHMVVGYAVSLVSSRIDMMSTMPTILALAFGTLADRGLQVGLATLFGEPTGQLEHPSVWLIAVVANTMLGLVLRGITKRFGGRR